MEQQSGKFLLNLVNNFGNEQAFFLIWGAIISIFSLLIYSGYRRTLRRNFRETPRKPMQKGVSAPPANCSDPGQNVTSTTPKGVEKEG